MKKLHKTGIAILSALAPAAALGVVAGIVVASLPKGEQEVDIDKFIERYTTIYNTYMSNYDKGLLYENSDVNNGVSGTKDKTTTLQGIKYEEKICRGQFGQDWLVISVNVTPAGLKEAFEQYKEAGYEIVCKISTDYIEFSVSNGTSSIEGKYNNNGYIMNCILEGGSQIDMTYTKEPHTPTIITKEAFGRAYDDLCDTYKAATTIYSKDDLSNYILRDQETTITNIEYTSTRKFVVIDPDGKTNTFDILNWYGNNKKWSDVESIFQEETVEGVTYKINADGSLEYTYSNATTRGTLKSLKFNKYGYLESYNTIGFGETSIKYNKDPHEPRTVDLSASAIANLVVPHGFNPYGFASTITETGGDTEISFKYKAEGATQDLYTSISLYDQDGTTLLQNLGRVVFKKDNTSETEVKLTFNNWSKIAASSTQVVLNGAVVEQTAKEKFCKKVGEFTNTFIGTTAKYQTSDISDLVISNVSIAAGDFGVYYDDEPGYRNVKITALSGGNQYAAASYLYTEDYYENDLLEEESGHTTYSISNDLITYKTDKAPEENGSISELAFNKYGYKIKEVYYWDGVWYTNSATFSNAPAK